MKPILIFAAVIIGFFIFAGAISRCGKNNSTTYVETVKHHAADGLNLKAVTDIAIKSKSAAELEKKLNEKGNKVNNLDLNEDNIVDYIKVTEVNSGTQKGFSLTTEVTGDKGLEEQELATIQFEQKADKNYRVQTHGNSHIYGSSHYYHRSYIGDMLMWNYLSSHHRPYRSNYGYGRYPSNFSSRQPMSQSQYSGFHQSQPYSSTTKKSSRSVVSQPLVSPNKGKTASNIKAPLKNPSTSQKSFQKRNPSKSVSRSSSFGGSSNRSSSSRYGSSSSSRSRSSFGGGK